jgi:hypothetical protein
VQSLVGRHLWQADLVFQVQFFDFMSEVLLYVSSGTSKFDFGPKNSQENFVKRTIL